MMRILLLVSFFFASFSIFAQSSNFNSQRNWSKNKKEVFLGGGATQFFGDLGGRDRIGTDYSPVDMDIQSTGFSLFAGYRYRWHPFWATKSQLSFGLVRGSDEHTAEIVRNTRNLHFRSPIVDFQQRLEFIVFSNEKVGKRYNLAGLKGMSEKNTQVYIFTGAGVTYFNPQAQYQGSWVNLRPLGTEGQGQADGPDRYLPVTATIPMGIGYRWTLTGMWRIGLEFSFIKTFTDYMDDVSGTYYSNYADPSSVDPMTLALANPAKANPGWFSHGQQRGDENLDNYVYLNVVFSKNITYKQTYKRNKLQKYRGSKAKF